VPAPTEEPASRRRARDQNRGVPVISTGAYGYPLAEAARIALTTVIAFLQAHPEIVLVRFVLFGPAALRAYEAVLGELSPAGSYPATG